MDKTKLHEQIDEYLDYCENIRVMSPSTLVTKANDLWLFERYTNIQSIEEMTNQTVNDWMEAQHLGEHIKLKMKYQHNGKKPCSNNTINLRIAHLKAFVKWCREMGIVIPNLQVPMIKELRIDPPKYIYYTREQINHVLAFADRKAWLMIRLSFECGLRIAELRTLQLSDINGRIINLGNKAKCKEIGDLVMSQETRIRLDDWIKRESITNYLWRGRPSADGTETPLCYRAARNCMEIPFFKAGFTDFHPHALRHSFATEIVENGATDAEAQHMLRHSDFTTSERYIHSLGVRTRKNFDRYMHCHEDEEIR